MHIGTGFDDVALQRDSCTANVQMGQRHELDQLTEEVGVQHLLDIALVQQELVNEEEHAVTLQAVSGTIQQSDHELGIIEVTNGFI